VKKSHCRESDFGYKNSAFLRECAELPALPNALLKELVRLAPFKPCKWLSILNRTEGVWVHVGPPTPQVYNLETSQPLPM